MARGNGTFLISPFLAPLRKLEQRQRPPLQRVGVARRERALFLLECRVRRIHAQHPARVLGLRGQLELHRFVVRVDQHQEVVVDDRAAALVALVEPAAGEKHAEAAREAVSPLLVRHLRAGRIEPDDVAHVLAADRAVLEEFAPAEHAMLAPQADQVAHELEQLAVSSSPISHDSQASSLSWQ